MNKKFYIVISKLILVLLSAVITSQAAPGDLDPTFDGDGKVTTCCGTSPGHSVAVQSDGKIVVGGWRRNLTTYFYEIWLVRYNTNGGLDTSFGNNGWVTTATVADVIDPARVLIAIQSDGKIVVANWASHQSNPEYGTYVYRYNTNGSLDPTFDNDGIVRVFGVHWTDVYYAYAVTIQSDGKILVAVRHHEDSLTNSIVQAFGVLRFNTNGSLDASFGNNGFVYTPSLFGNARSEDVPLAIAVQPDGKIILVGLARRSDGTRAFGVVRYDPNGSLDTSFDGDGIVTTQIGVYRGDQAYSVGVQPDGKIVVGGYSDFVGSAVVRYNPDGSLDTSFGGDGIVTVFDGLAYSNKLIIQSNGKIVIGSGNYDGDFELLRFNPTGSPDSTWGTGGIITTDFGGDDNVWSMALQTDGKIIAVGNTSGSIAMARYLGDAAPTAASVSVSGRVSDTNGRGISKARVTIQDAATGETQTALTNAFGYYRLEEIAAGHTYILEAAHKRYQFAPRVLSVRDDITDADLIAEP